MDTFSTRLREARTEKGLTQKELAERIGVTKGRVTHYETNKGHPNTPVLLEICRVLNVSSDWLLGLTDRKEV